MIQILLLKPFHTSSEILSKFLRKWLIVGLALLGNLGVARAQGDTEIYLVTLAREGDSYRFGLPENATRNPGYDNQPSFTADSALLYASTRNGQTDIASLDLASRSATWLSDTPGGGEYSPLPIPGNGGISAIRLDTTGLQRLYEYRDGESRLLFEDLKVGYQVWAGPDLLVCTVLVEEGMDLVAARPGSGTVATYQQGVGRSLQRIPGTRLISYTSAAQEGWVLNSIDPVSGATESLTPLPAGVQDVCWLPDGSVLCGGDGVLRRLRPGKGAAWQVVHDFGPGLGTISRLAANEAGTLLALVVAPNP